MTQKTVAVTGNEAVAEALKQVKPDVCAVYPITPQTDLMQQFSTFVANGLVTTELLLSESEHSAMSSCIGASAAGGRVVTATSGPGLALMWEMLFVASGMRLPIVMPVVNRALSAPLNIHCDHSDAMGARDCGWLQFWSENSQEAYDNVIQSFRVAEHKDVLLPAMVCMDGFITSHAVARVEYLEAEVVQMFCGEYSPRNPLLDISHPVSYGPLVLTDQYHEYKKLQDDAMQRVFQVVEEVADAYAKISGRTYGLFEAYRLEDAEIGIVVLNSSAGTSKEAIDEAREKGIKVGLLKPRLFRPFPYSQIGDALQHLKALCVLDRADSFGGFGPLYSEIAAALYHYTVKPLLVNRIYGLGGRDYLPEHALKVIEEMSELTTGNPDSQAFMKKYIGVRF